MESETLIEKLEAEGLMREALRIEQLRSVYDRLARRYDLQHTLVTAGADQRGRRILIENSIHEGNTVLDFGSGTGTMGIMAAKKVGPKGKVTLFDLSRAMLSIAREKVRQEGLQDRVTFRAGDMATLPFENDYFDVVLSTYSLCPLYDPEKAALELYRVTKPGGKLAIGHSVEPRNSLVKWLADRVEDMVWHFPWLSMGCRSVSVLPALKRAGGRVIFSRYIGVPLWPFLIFLLEKAAIR